jgi:cytochrome c biogenesis protein CcmG/thiol:disulfide interchange protein DsbE
MKNEKLVRYLQVSAVVVLAALCWAVAQSMVEKVAEVGDTAPRFRVTTETGKTLTEKDFGGKLLVLNFWASWCPPCQEETPSMNQFAQAMRPKGVVVLGISVDERPGAYQRFLQREKVAFETALDPTSDISASYGTFKFPETYVIDRDGRVLRKYIGPRDWTDPEIVKDIATLL